MRSITLYHVTTAENAEAILRDGFPEIDSFFGAADALVGVWLSDRPLNSSDGALGDAILAVAFNIEPGELSFYELVDNGRSFRQWCLPASLIRRHGKVSIVPTETDERFWSLTDIEYLERLFLSVHKTDVAIKDSIAALEASKTLLLRAQQLLDGQTNDQAPAKAAPVAKALDILVRTVVEQSQGKARAAFYIADAAGRELYHVTGMPQAYANFVDGFAISPESLACGLAAATGQPIITSDVRAEPRWKPWLWLAREFDYRACWSFPVQNSGGKVVGTFAIYYKEPTEATQQDIDLASELTRAAAAIISVQ